MVKRGKEFDRFADLKFNDFRILAEDEQLSPHERIGFPDSYRQHMEERILADIRTKLTHLDVGGSRVVDIGPGCGRLADAIVDHCRGSVGTLVLVDSKEVLDHLPEDRFILKVAGRFPDCCKAFLEDHREQVDAVLVYSVLHYVFVESSVFDFLDHCLELLAPGGQLLLGDIPNRSMRDRLFSSEAGRRFHREFMKTDEDPEVTRGIPVPGDIDDSVLLALLARARAAGFHAYLVPQAPTLPMANRREDILIERP